jgi:hypothetical protein
MPKNNSLTQKYSDINYKAIKRICKAMEIYLHISVQDFLKHDSPIMPTQKYFVHPI